MSKFYLNRKKKLNSEKLGRLFSTSRKIEKLYTYSHLKHDEDTADDEYMGLNKQATTLYHEFGETTSWLTPELLSLPQEKIDSFLNSKELQDYKFYLEKIVREKDHICSSEVEEVLAQAGDALGTATKVFGALNNADISFGSVLDSEGKEKPLSHVKNFIILNSKGNL
jgi:oligoendopeptidase F